MPRRFDFSREERALIARCDSPEKVQRFLNGLDYNYEKDGGSTLRTLRRVLRDRTAHCLEGALAAAAILGQHGHPARFLCMEARDIDHNLFLYRSRGRWGSVSMSRDPNLRGRPARFRTLRELVLEYYPYYWNWNTKDLTDLTIRGYARWGMAWCRQDWVTAEEDVAGLEDHLYGLVYTALWPTPGRDRFVSPRSGKLRWLKR